MIFLADQISIIMILKISLERPYLDFYIVNQGETGFLELINKYSEGKLDRKPPRHSTNGKFSFLQ